MNCVRNHSTTARVDRNLPFFELCSSNTFNHKWAQIHHWLLNIPPLTTTFLFQVDKGMRDVLQSDELFDCKQVNYLLPYLPWFPPFFSSFFSEIDFFFALRPKFYIPSDYCKQAFWKVKTWAGFWQIGFLHQVKPEILNNIAIPCDCQRIMSAFRLLGIYSFALCLNW